MHSGYRGRWHLPKWEITFTRTVKSGMVDLKFRSTRPTYFPSQLCKNECNSVKCTMCYKTQIVHDQEAFLVLRKLFKMLNEGVIRNGGIISIPRRHQLVWKLGQTLKRWLGSSFEFQIPENITYAIFHRKLTRILDFIEN